jgi:hypothetical protein
MIKRIIHDIAVPFILILIVGACSLFAQSSTPPAGNIDMPLTIGATDEVKSGRLELSTLLVSQGSLFDAVQTDGLTVQSTGTSTFANTISVLDSCIKKNGACELRSLNYTGVNLLTGSGAPSDGLGRQGDFYLDTVAKDFYGPKGGSAWDTPNNLVGDVGYDGWKGPRGDCGDTLGCPINTYNVSCHTGTGSAYQGCFMDCDGGYWPHNITYNGSSVPLTNVHVDVSDFNSVGNYARIDIWNMSGSPKQFTAQCAKNFRWSNEIYLPVTYPIQCVITGTSYDVNGYGDGNCNAKCAPGYHATDYSLPPNSTYTGDLFIRYGYFGSTVFSATCTRDS